MIAPPEWLAKRLPRWNGKRVVHEFLQLLMTRKIIKPMDVLLLKTEQYTPSNIRQWIKREELGPSVPTAVLANALHQPLGRGYSPPATSIPAGTRMRT